MNIGKILPVNPEKQGGIQLFFEIVQGFVHDMLFPARTDEEHKLMGGIAIGYFRGWEHDPFYAFFDKETLPVAVIRGNSLQFPENIRIIRREMFLQPFVLGAIIGAWR